MESSVLFSEPIIAISMMPIAGSSTRRRMVGSMIAVTSVAPTPGMKPTTVPTEIATKRAIQ